MLLLILFCILNIVYASNDDRPGVIIDVYKNGGNNTLNQREPLKMTVFFDQSFNDFLLRAAAKLNYLPADCTPFSIHRPRRPLSYFGLPNSPDREPDERCAGYPSYLPGLRAFDEIGRQLWSLAHLREGESVFIVPPGDHFFWPGQYVGRWISLPDVRIPREGMEAEDEAHNDRVRQSSPVYNTSELVGEPLRLYTVSLVPRIFYIPRLLTNHETDLVRAHANGLRRSTGFGAGGKADVTAERTSRNTWLNCNEQSKTAFACVIERRVARLLRMPYAHVKDHSDTLQVLHYEQGQKYNAHTDWFDPTQAPKTPGLKEGFNRMLTVFMYLTDTSRGGGTVFPHAGDPLLNPGIDQVHQGQFRGVNRDGSPLPDADADATTTSLYNPYPLGSSVDFTDCSRGIMGQPTRASAVMWYNMLVWGNGHEGFPDPRSLHGGCPPSKDADKWAVNKWVYNHNWQHRQQQDTWEQELPHPVDRRPQQPLSEFVDAQVPAAQYTQFSKAFREQRAEQLREEKQLPPPPPPLDPDDAPTGMADAGAVQATVTNQCESRVKLLWIDPQSSDELLQSHLEPGSTHQVNSFHGHRFLARNESGDTVLGEFEAQSNGSNHWNIGCVDLAAAAAAELSPQ